MDWSNLAYGATGWGDELLAGFGVTLTIAISSYAIGTAVGTVFGIIEMKGPRPIAAIFQSYSSVFRSIPELLVIFMIYYAGAAIIQMPISALGLSTVIEIDPIVAGIIALSIVQSAYTSEIVKGAIRAVPSGLIEAAYSLGMRPVTAFGSVVLPLALRFAFPGLANLWMVVIKNTPFVTAIGVADLMGQASTAGQNTKEYLLFFLTVLVVYLAMSGISMALQLRIERALRHYNQ